MTNKIRILIIEPSEIISAGLQKLFSEYREFETEAIDDFSICSQKCISFQPDIVIISPDCIPFYHKSSVRNYCPELQNKIIAAIVHDLFDEETLRQYNTVLNIYDAGATISAKLHKAIKSENKTTGNDSRLSEREKEILISVARGKTNKEIADNHNISIHTVISHRKNITHKTGIKSVAGLTVYAILENLIDQNSIDL